MQSFAAYYGKDCLWCNREDDARDKGLRMSKLQYLPQELGGKVRIDVGTELDSLTRIPTVKSERLTLTPCAPPTGTITTPCAWTMTATAGGATTTAPTWATRP